MTAGETLKLTRCLMWSQRLRTLRGLQEAQRTIELCWGHTNRDRRATDPGGSSSGGVKADGRHGRCHHPRPLFLLVQNCLIKCGRSSGTRFPVPAPGPCMTLGYQGHGHKTMAPLRIRIPHMFTSGFGKTKREQRSHRAGG